MVNKLDKEMDVDKYKIRNWAKEDFPALAKYLEVARNQKLTFYFKTHSP